MPTTKNPLYETPTGRVPGAASGYVAHGQALSQICDVTQRGQTGISSQISLGVAFLVSLLILLYLLFPTALRPFLLKKYLYLASSDLSKSCAGGIREPASWYRRQNNFVQHPNRESNGKPTSLLFHKPSSSPSPFHFRKSDTSLWGNRPAKGSAQEPDTVRLQRG